MIVLKAVVMKMAAPNNANEPLSLKQLETIANFGDWTGSNKCKLHIGCVGCGKTRSILIGFGLYCKTHKPGRLGFLLLGKTATLAESNMGDMLDELFGENFIKTRSKQLDSKSKDALLYGHRIYWGGMNDSISIQRVLGKSYKAIIIDELTSISQENFMLLSDRLRGESPHWIEASTNPQGEKHWLYQMLKADEELPPQDRMFKVIRWYKEDNICSWAKDFYDGLTKKYKVGTPLYDRNVLGKWRSSGDLVYGDVFNSKIHILTKQELLGARYKYFKIGIDYGLENPTVALLCGVMPMGEHVILREYYKPNAKDLDEVLTGIIRLYNNAPGKVIGIYVDPSATAIKKGLESKGIYCVKKANNDVIDGIAEVTRMFVNETLFICEECENTIAETVSYEWSKKDGEIVKKKDDHCPDALRYLVMEGRK